MNRLLHTLAAAAVLLGVTLPAHAVDYGSGAAGGPVGTPVLSTVPYTAVSDVMIVGDSITIRGYKDLAAALPGKRLAVNAHSGRNTKASVDSLFASMQAGMVLPPVLIMAVGSNDVMSPFAFEAQMKRLLAGVPRGTRVFWMDIYVNRPAYPSSDLRNTDVINKRIWRYCTGNCSIISWFDFLAGYPSYRIRTHIDSGGVHQTVAGCKAWAAVIAAGIR